MTPEAPAALDPFFVFVNVGYGIMLLGFVLRDVLKLRTALIIGQIFVVIYNCHRGVIPSAVWNCLYMGINIVWVSLIIEERRPAKIPSEISDLYNSVFAVLTPKEFLAFWKAGSVQQWSDAVVINKNDTPKDVFLVLAGAAHVESDGRKLASLRRGRFFSEMSFLTGRPASATIRGDEKLNAIAWPQHFLRDLKTAKPALFLKIQGILGSELALKLREANEAVSSPSA